MVRFRLLAVQRVMPTLYSLSVLSSERLVIRILQPPAFNSTPVFPRSVDRDLDAVFAFSPDFHSGYVDSWSFGYQRQLGRDTVVEFRYVGNRGKDLQSQYRINEINAIENGFGAEFFLAQQNLLANINANRGPANGANFRYFGTRHRNCPTADSDVVYRGKWCGSECGRELCQRRLCKQCDVDKSTDWFKSGHPGCGKFRWIRT